jgi:hypothetical protein
MPPNDLRLLLRGKIPAMLAALGILLGWALCYRPSGKIPVPLEARHLKADDLYKT